MRAKRRRSAVVVVAFLVVLAPVAVVSAFAFYGTVGTSVFQSKVLPKIEKRLGRSFKYQDIDIERGYALIRGIEIEDDHQDKFVNIDEVELDFDSWSPLSGEVDVRDVRAKGVHVTLKRNASGETNVKQLVARFASKNEGNVKAQGSSSSSFVLHQFQILSGDVSVIDEKTGASVHAQGMKTLLKRGDSEVALALSEVEVESSLAPEATLRELDVFVDRDNPLESARVMVGDGSVKLWSEMTLTGVKGELKRGDESETLALDFAGSYGGAKEQLWTAKGWVDPKKQGGEVTIEAERFTFDRIASVLQESEVVDFDQTSLDTSVTISMMDGLGELSGDLDIFGLNLLIPRLAPETMTNLSGQAHVEAAWDVAARSINIHQAEINFGGVTYQMIGDVFLPGGIERREHPKLSFNLKVPQVECQTVITSIPKEFAPKFSLFKLKGMFQADLQVDIDWSDLDATMFTGNVGIDGCKVLHAPYLFNTKRLDTPFKYEILVGKDRWKRVRLGDSEKYVPLSEVSPYIWKAMLTQEDSGFERHRGFIKKEFRTALIKNLKAGQEEGKWILFKWGASSITMQTVKNVFLSREKTISRKLQELFLTWYLEKKQPKERILEIYVNAIEYGPGIYGIKPATLFYFNKLPSEVTPIEAAFIASLLPAPRRYYFAYCRDKVTRTKKLANILRNMYGKDRLTEDEYTAAMELHASDLPIVFNPNKDKALCRRPVDW